MGKKSNKDNKYVYSLIECSDSGCGKTIGDKTIGDKTISDYVFASDIKDAYEIVTSVCGDINSKYGASYSVQSIVPLSLS